jgi:hypothetical protein
MTADRCEAELCPNWTGHGCICVAIGIEPETLACRECEDTRGGCTLHDPWEDDDGR